MDGIGLVGLGAGLGAGLAIVGGGGGISRLAAAAVEAIARQPEAAGDIKGSMIITAAFIEGVTLFAIVVCLLLALNTAPAA
jgi:F-type H+-transporting ATPase subunit c